VKWGQRRNENPEYITIRLPKSHWLQIVDDLENMCGTTASNIEILANVEAIGTHPPVLPECRDAAGHRQHCGRIECQIGDGQ
jgi:hypothetical protein